ncbi:MAG: glycosyltransferase family 9 protein [Rhodospirillaceae bacterium]
MKILFITSNRLGDAVLSAGLLGHLVESCPQARFTIACGPVAAPLFRALPRLDRVIAFAKRRCSSHWFGLWGSCIGTGWGFIVDLRNSAVSRLLFTRRLVTGSRPAEDCHRVEHLARIFGLAEVPPPRLWFADSDLDAARALIPDGPPVLALGPTANWRGKTWRAERFAAVAMRLTGPGGILAGARVAVLAAANEREQAQPVIDAFDPARLIDLVGRTDSLQVGACLARTALFVGNDSGLMHIAAAAGTTTLGLFGPSRPEHYAPWGAHCAAVTTAIPYRDLVWGPGYDHRTTGTLMDSLDVDTVVNAAGALWLRGGPDRESA